MVRALAILQVAVTQNRTVPRPCPSLAFVLEAEIVTKNRRGGFL